MTRIELYYCVKWDTLNKLDVLPSVILNIAIQDLRLLLRIEIKLHKNEKYKNIFWGYGTENVHYPLNKDKKKSNLPISKIWGILKEKFTHVDFLNHTNDMDRVIKLFDVLNEIDNQNESNIYLLSIYKIIFKHIINDNNKGNKFLELFYSKMKEQDLPEYLISIRNEVSKKILLSGELVSNDILKYLLDCIELKDAIVILIFRLAYAERSGRAMMKIDEFKVWENAIDKLMAREDIIIGDNLKESKFIDYLCCEISKSNISHFVFEQFIQWMWYSLFEKFDEERYEKFIMLGRDGLRKNFSLDSYIIIRLLLCDKSYGRLEVSEFKEEKRKQIENELCSIKDILKAKDIDI